MKLELNHQELFLIRMALKKTAEMQARPIDADMYVSVYHKLTKLALKQESHELLNNTEVAQKVYLDSREYSDRTSKKIVRIIEAYWETGDTESLRKAVYLYNCITGNGLKVE